MLQFRVTGENRETGARQTMEIAAENRAAAERKASNLGLNVTHVEAITPPDAEPHARASHRGEDAGTPGGRGRLITLLIVLAILAIVAYFLWSKIKAVMES